MRLGKVPANWLDRVYDPGDILFALRVVQGQAEFRLPSGTCRLKAGEWIFPGQQKGWRILSKEAEVLSVRFRVCWPAGQTLFDHSAPLLPEKAICAELDKGAFPMVRYIQEELSEDGVRLQQVQADLSRYLRLRYGFEEWFESYVRAMSQLGLLWRPASDHDSRVLEALRLMKAGLQTGVLFTEKEIAQRVGVSLSHFKRLFAKEMKQSPLRWFDEHRLNLAKERLALTGLPIKRIGYELGFSSDSHFSSWFKSHSSLTPGQFRQSESDKPETGAAAP